MALSLMKPPNASNSNLANAGKNLNAYRLVKSLIFTTIIQNNFYSGVIHLALFHILIAFRATLLILRSSP